MLLSKPVVKSLSSDINPESFHLWSASFLAFINKLRCSASDVLLVSDEQWLANLSDNVHGQAWLDLDSYMSTTLFACFDTASTSKHVEVLSQRLKRTNGLQSGRAIWLSLSEAANPTTGPRKQERDRTLAAKTYFTTRPSAVEVELAMEHLLTDWSSSSDGKVGDPVTFIKYLCTKLPASLHIRAEAIEAEAYRAEVLTQYMPWTFRQLTELVSIAFRANTPATKVVSAAEQATINAAFWAQKRDQDGKQPGGGGKQPDGAKQCPLCSSFEHAYAKCKRNCSRCNCKSCPASMRTGKCIFETNSVDPKMKNALGKVVPGYIVKKLEKILASGAPRPHDAKAFQAEQATAPPPAPAEQPSTNTAYRQPIPPNAPGHVSFTCTAPAIRTPVTTNVGL